MTEPQARRAIFPRLRRGRDGAGRGNLGPLVVCMIAVASAAAAQDKPAKPPLAADLQAAMKRADAGSPADLTKLADSGRADAQYYAGVMLIFGRGAIPRDTVRGCAYEEKASATRADAMHLVGECFRLGLSGRVDAEKAKAAYMRADQMGFPKSKCALGEMLLAEPSEASRGLALCKEAASAGDVDAQIKIAEFYFNGVGVKKDRAEARKWYEKAAVQRNPEAARKLGEMYANGDGGKRDVKKAVSFWQMAEKAGDPLAPILVADQLFSELTGGRKPGPGTYGFKGGVPVADIEVIEQWYGEALKRDPRPEVKARAQSALGVLASLKSAGQVAVKKR